MPKRRSTLGELDRQTRIAEPRNGGRPRTRSLDARERQMRPRPRVEILTCDTGAPIELHYRRSSSVPRSPALAARWDAEASWLGDSEPFSVESFGDSPLAPSEDGDGAVAGAKILGDRPVSEPEELPTGEQATEVRPTEDQPTGSMPAVPPPPSPPAAVPASASTAARALSDDDLASDLEAISRQTATSTEALAPPAETPKSAAEVPAEPSAAEPPAEHPHSVFDRMAGAMRYANTFDLGAVKMSQRFDAFERELDREEATAAALRLGAVLENASPHLGDLDVAADLAQIADEGTPTGPSRPPVEEPKAEAPSAGQRRPLQPEILPAAEDSTQRCVPGRHAFRSGISAKPDQTPDPAPPTVEEQDDEQPTG